MSVIALFGVCLYGQTLVRVFALISFIGSVCRLYRRFYYFSVDFFVLSFIVLIFQNVTS